MQAFVLAAMSFLLTSSVIGNAYYQKKQFYPSVVYITKSNPSMAVLYIQAFVFVVLMGKLMRKIFFGQLRAAEMEHLIERSWYAVTETCLAFTVFRDDFSPRFVGMFTLLLFLKCFHWLAEDRVDFMERSPIITILFHLRVLCLLLVLAAVDLHFINLAYYSTILKGASVQLVFGFEYAILLTVVLMTLTKYILHTIDVQSENPWENKAVYLLYTELIMGLIKVLLYALFVVIMIKVHTFPLFAIRPMYLSVRAFKKALHDVIMSRRAIRNMNTLYPDATSEELMSGDNVCIICREEMITACKKLPCNHIFHASCLRSWFQRQQTCPTCRMDVLRVHRPQQSQQQQQQPQQQQQQQQQQQVPPAQPPHFSPNMMLPGFHPMWPFPPPPPPPTSTSATNVTTPEMRAASSTATAEGASAASFMPFSPFCMPYGFPSPPPVLSSVPAEELKILEGHERSNVEARVQWLKDIQSLLDGAMLLINQYNLVAAQMGLQGISAIAQQNTSAASTPEKSSKNTSCEKKSSEDSEVKSGLNSSQLPQTEVLDLMGLEGATGYTPPPQEITPVWEDSHEEMHENELHEVRRRRIQHFSKEQKSTNSKVEDNLELD